MNVRGLKIDVKKIITSRKIFKIEDWVTFSNYELAFNIIRDIQSSVKKLEIKDCTFLNI